jgi:hypothetical protein
LVLYAVGSSLHSPEKTRRSKRNLNDIDLPEDDFLLGLREIDSTHGVREDNGESVIDANDGALRHFTDDKRYPPSFSLLETAKSKNALGCQLVSENSQPFIRGSLTSQPRLQSIPRRTSFPTVFPMGA